LEYVKDIFKALEILDEIEVEDVTLERDEASFGPIKSQHHYYKSILPSRLDKIHYRIRITPSEDIKPAAINLGKQNAKSKKATSESFIKEGDIYINKLIDNCFYINEGVRYFLIYQIVDNSTYGTENAVSLKSLLMPITVKQHTITAVPEFFGTPVNIKSFETLLFAKAVNPVLYCLGKDSYNSLVNYKPKDPDNLYSEWLAYKDPTLIDKLNSFFRTDFEFSDSSEKLKKPGRVVFKIQSEKAKNDDNCCYISVSESKLNEDTLT